MDNSLIRYLDNHTKGKIYAGKIREITPLISDWLAYTVHTFPHYTRHTIKHSEKIIEELSLLLFKRPNAKKPRPIIEISAVEAYIFLCAAYLHDAGMVISDKDKMEILDSLEWRDWISKGDGLERYKKLLDYKSCNISSFADDRNSFSYNIELRLLIAEFVRRSHHFRSGKLIELSTQSLGGFDFNDPPLRKTIADICVAHGLDASDLNDDERYPDIRTIRGEQVNVKLLVILFRLGDLLDMSCDRACPSLTAAANPIPSYSKPHWDQYAHILHRKTHPDAIEIQAECNSQEEHRALQNWCTWIESECKNATFVVPRMSMHNKWRVPEVKIRIKPAKSATYIAEDWRFVFDEEKIIRRLIQDVHPDDLGFLNELIQNALDATRCQMYNDLKESQQIPTNPWQIPEAIRQKYPLRIEIKTEKKENQFTGGGEEILTITVEDCGIGMSKDIVKNYFLQIGRSYYASSDFSEKYTFQPISRFGIGFLSVFSKSNYVEVETYKLGAEPIKMRLEGPKNYLLLEKSSKNHPGTSVKVYLDDSNLELTAIEYIKKLCNFVEFPIYLTHNGEETIIKSESPDDICYKIPDGYTEGNEFILKAFPVLTNSLYGYLYVLAYKTPSGEDWSQLYYAGIKYPKVSPTADLPILYGNLLCFNGIGLKHDTGYRRNNKIERIDIRAKVQNISLQKNLDFYPEYDVGYINYSFRSELDDMWKNILGDHIKESCSNKTLYEKWLYLQELPEEFPIDGFWDGIKGTVLLKQNNLTLYTSLNEWQKINEFATIRDDTRNEVSYDGYWLNVKYEHCHTYREKLFDQYLPVSIERKDHRETIIWRKCTENPYSDFKNLMRKYDRLYNGTGIYICPIRDIDRLSISIFRTMNKYQESVILNASHPFIKWLIKFSALLERLNPKPLELEKAIENLFIHHFEETIFATFYTRDRLEAYESLRSYLSYLESMPWFPKVEKIPINTVVSQW